LKGGREERGGGRGGLSGRTTGETTRGTAGGAALSVRVPSPIHDEIDEDDREDRGRTGASAGGVGKEDDDEGPIVGSPTVTTMNTANTANDGLCSTKTPPTTPSRSPSRKLSATYVEEETCEDEISIGTHMRMHPYMCLLIVVYIP
jgi:hypothetical protein